MAEWSGLRNHRLRGALINSNRASANVATNPGCHRAGDCPPDFANDPEPASDGRRNRIYRAG